jgi:SAM-dependent methyltransferase
MADARAQVFGTVAEEYDRFRPGYAEELVDDVLAYAATGTDATTGSGAATGTDAATALEVGAGTGKATVAFAARGLRITAVEPDPAMVAVLARNVAPYPDVSVELTTFEGYEPAGARFDLLYCAQAWHWTDEATRWDRAAALLRPGGALALCWHHHWLTEPDQRATVSEVYRTAAVGLVPSETLLPDEDDNGWPSSDLVRLPEFTDLVELTYRRPAPMSIAKYVARLNTVSDHRVLADADRARLFAALADALPDGVLLEDVVYLYLARRR